MSDALKPAEFPTNDTQKPEFIGSVAEHAPDNTVGKTVVMLAAKSAEYLLSSAVKHTELLQLESVDQTGLGGVLPIQYVSIFDTEALDQVEDVVAQTDDKEFHSTPEYLKELTAAQIEDHDIVSTTMSSEVQKLRSYFNALDTTAVSAVDEYFENSAPPSVWLAKVKAGVLGDWSKWLDSINDTESGKWTRIRRYGNLVNRKSWSDWLVREATEEELVNVFEWHNHVLGEQAIDPELRKIIDKEKLRFVRHANELFAIGALSRQPKSLDTTRILINDMFDTAAKGWGGYYSHVTDTIVMHQGYGQTSEARLDSVRTDAGRVLIHEFVHSAVSTMPEYPSSPVHASWISEALTQIISEVIRQDSGEKVKKDTYKDEVGLFYKLINKATDGYSILLAAFKAYSGDLNDAEVFTSLVDQAWGTSGVLQDINRIVGFHETKKIQSGVPDRQAKVESLAIATDLLRNSEDQANYGTKVNDLE